MAVELTAADIEEPVEAFEEILASPGARIVDEHGHVVYISKPLAGFMCAAVEAAHRGNAYLFDHSDTLSPAQAAQILGVSRPMIYRYIEDGLLEDQPINSYHRIPAASVHRLAESRRGAAQRAAQLLREDPDHPRVTAARERVRARRAQRDA